MRRLVVLLLPMASPAATAPQWLTLPPTPMPAIRLPAGPEQFNADVPHFLAYVPPR